MNETKHIIDVLIIAWNNGIYALLLQITQETDREWIGANQNSFWQTEEEEEGKKANNTVWGLFALRTFDLFKLNKSAYCCH